MFEVPRRSDALPEGHDWKDTGCDFHPACLTCPFVVCRYEAGFYRHLREIRDAEIEARILSGKSVDTVAREMGISRRTVFRVLEARRG